MKEFFIMILDPLEQFSIEMFNGYFFSYTIPTSIGKMVSFNFMLLLVLLYNGNEPYFKRSNKLQKITLNLFHFISGVLKDSLTVKKYSFSLIFYSIFLFICFSNLLGMIPYSMTVTSHLILTLYFSLALFLGNNLIGICYHKEKYFVLFLPEGVPTPIIPFLILIEYLSYLSRILSLAIRLFANMMSGHILLKILISFIWAIMISNFIHWFWILLPLTIIFGVIGLEFAIAFLQGYVFIVLVSIYLNDVINTH